MDAVFPLARDHMAYPDMIERGLEPHKVRELLFFGTEDINHYSDITQTLDKKVAALGCHASQVSSLGNGNLEAWIRERYSKLAEGSGYELAEAFHRLALPS